ncbi:MAG: tetratricopeptide repeat protein [Acidobacteria bacterium]|nr:tetratricopeptide repeat protein [Acidobacteriota bacterium]
MAKINPIKVKQEADKAEKAGKVDQAIGLYRQIVDDNPRDWNTINKIGDLYAKLNKFREASLEYAKVADFYAKDGFLLKAIAIWKKINKLDASALEPYLNLADLYAKQGLMMEAKSQYQIVVDEYIKRGKMRDAGDVLKKMAEIDPGDLKVRSKLADLYTRDGNAAKAVEEHVAIADELTKKGHLAEALQVLEKGLKLDAKSNRIRLELARIHLVQKNWEKASYYLEEAVQRAPSDTQALGRLGEAYLGGKKIEEAEAIFKRLLELDPNDQDSRVQMARVYTLQGQLDRAFEKLVPLVDRMIERKDADKAAGVLQQLVQADPSHVPTLLKLVEIYRVLQNDAAVVSSYSQLTEAYINQGQMAQAAGVLEVLVSMEPQNQQHKTKLQFVKGKLSGGPAAPVPRPAPSATAPEIEEEEFDLTTPSEAPAFADFEAPATPALSMPRGPAPASAAVARPQIEVTGPLSEEDREFIEEHLAEGRVFRKYGLVDKAADQFESILARFPDHADARQELRDVYKEKGQNAKAAEQCLALAEILRLKGDEAQAEAFEAEARSLAPEAAPARPAASKVAPAPKPAPPRPAPPPPAPVEAAEEEIALPEADEEIPLEVEEAGLESESLDAGSEGAAELPSLDLGEEIGAEAPGELPAHFVEEEPAAEEFDLGTEEPAAPPPPPVRAVPPPKPVPSAKPAPPRKPAPPPPPVEEVPLDLGGEEFPLEEPAPPPPPAPLKAVAPRPPLAQAPARPAPAAPVAPSLPHDLRKVLDEVDSYVSLGFVDDAKEALREVGTRYPGHPAILEKIGELGFDQEVVEEEAPAVEEPFGLGAEEELPPPPAAEEPSPLDEALGDLDLPEPEAPPPPEPFLQEPVGGETGGVDLGAELGELFGAQAAVEEPAAEAASTELGDAGLAEIFKEFKKGVDKQLGKEDYDTRYNLGIAYKEMGLIDEAIAEFQLAAKDEGRLLECASMLGICFVEKGMPKLAVKWFEKGLKAPGRSEEEYQGLRYDLAMALEAAGEADKALSIFTELYGQDANFRDVATKVRELKAALR